MIGTLLSHYRIAARLGAGGMGEVYRASDENLGRDVAIKMLPEDMAKDAERLAISRRSGPVVRYEVLSLDWMTPTLVTDLRVDYTAGPVWHPDGRHLIVSKFGWSSGELWSYDVEGNEPHRRLAQVPGTYLSPHSFSPEGRYLALTAYSPETNADVLILDLAESAGQMTSLKPFVHAPGWEYFPSFSPDGRFLAYTSEVSGRPEVYVRRFPGGEGLTRISQDGGYAPRWSPRGDEIYFVSKKLIASRITSDRDLRVGGPRVLFESDAFTGLGFGTSYDVAPDGRLLVRELPEDPYTAREIVVVQNWFEEVKRLAP